MNTPSSSALTIVQSAELVRQSTDIAGLCRDIVVKSAMEIQQRKYIKVEGWLSLATAHGCIASSHTVERIEGGYRAIGEVRRMADGVVIAQAEGFVGEDEPTWFGGDAEVWDKVQRRRVTKTLPRRPDYAIRAMAQTRAISRACRSAFAHIVVLMDAGLSTTPAEEVPHGGFDNEGKDEDARQERREQQSEAAGSVHNWRDVAVHFGKNKGTPLSKLQAKSIKWYANSLREKRDGKGEYPASKDDLKLLAACEMALMELDPQPGMKSAHAPKDDPDELPMSDGQNVRKLAERLEWAGHTKEDFIKVGLMSKWIDADAWHKLSDEAAAGALADFNEVVLPALDTHKKGAGK